MDYEEGAKIFKALGDVKRMMIIDMLSVGELCACMILEKFKLSQSTLSHHMKLLCESGVVRGRNEGKWTYYSLDPEGIARARQFFDDLTADREPRIPKYEEGCCQ